MERLTYVTEDGKILFYPEDLPEDEGMTVKELAENRRWKTLDQIAEKLTNMEQMEEQGLLVRLPRKVEDSVFIIVGKDISKQGIRKIEISGNGIIFKTSRQKRIFNVSEFEKSVFLTREEAEKKLEEMKNGKK